MEMQWQDGRNSVHFGCIDWGNKHRTTAIDAADTPELMLLQNHTNNTDKTETDPANELKS